LAGKKLTGAGLKKDLKTVFFAVRNGSKSNLPMA